MKATISSVSTPHPFSLRAILIIVLLEIFLGGGGRLFDIGPLSLRMYFYALAMTLSAVIVVNRQTIDRNFTFLLLIFTILLVCSALIGAYNGAPVKLILNDIKPLFSIYLLIFLAFAIRTKADILLVVKLIKFSATIMALSYIIFLVLINTKILPFPRFYALVSDSEEFFFRGNFAFFYKGFIYICVGLIFISTSERINRLLILILVASIVLSFTRGFLIALMLTYLFYLIFIRRSALKLILITFVLAISVIGLWEFIYSKMDRGISDSYRIRQIEEVFTSVTPVTVFIGHGFGNGVPSRPERMEIAYLEIFHKQGVMGISFWVLLFFLNWQLYRSAVRNGNSRLAEPFLLSVVLIYLQSFTNPYVNNSIGLTMILVSLVCLNLLRNKNLLEGS